jgi:hypothetical protein
VTLKPLLLSPDLEEVGTKGGGVGWGVLYLCCNSFTGAIVSGGGSAARGREGGEGG